MEFETGRRLPACRGGTDGTGSPEIGTEANEKEEDRRDNIGERFDLLFKLRETSWAAGLSSMAPGIKKTTDLTLRPRMSVNSDHCPIKYPQQNDM